MKTIKSNKRRKGCGEKADTFHCWWKCKLVQTYWKDVYAEIQQVVKETIPCVPEVFLLGLTPDSDVQWTTRDTVQLMLAIARITLAASWKQKTVPHIHMWKKNFGSILYWEKYKKLTLEQITLH